MLSDDDDDDDDESYYPSHHYGYDDDDEEEGTKKSSRSGGLIFLTVVALAIPFVALFFAGNKLLEIWRVQKVNLIERNEWLSRMTGSNGNGFHGNGFRDEHDIHVGPRRDSAIDQIPTRVLSSTALSFDSEPTRGVSNRKPYSPQPFVPYSDTDGTGDDDQSDMQQIPIGSIRGIELC